MTSFGERLYALTAREGASPAGRIRAVGRVLDKLGAIDQLEAELSLAERADGEQLAAFVRDCLTAHANPSRPTAGDARWSLIRGRNRSLPYDLLQEMARALGNAAINPAFSDDAAQDYLEPLDPIIRRLDVTGDALAQAFAAYNRDPAGWYFDEA